MFKKILDLLNIHPDKNQRWLLLSAFVSLLLITYINPILVKTIITALPSEWLAFESLFTSVSAAVVGMIWKGKTREVAIKYFFILALIESISGFILGLYLCFVKFNVWVYAICSLFYSAFITTFVGKCIMAFKAKLWQDKEREIYDNNNSIVVGIVCIIGYALALLFMPPLKLALFLWGICCIVDDIGWIIVYKKNQEILKQVEE